MSKRSILARLAILVPALVLTVAMVSTMSCGGGLFPEVNNSKTPTATPSGGTGAFAFVTDFNTGKVVSFTRNLTTGGLKRGDSAKAGAAKGPTGMAVSPNNSFLYVLNSSDNNIYGYTISSSGAPSPFATPTSEGANSAPQQAAITPNGTLMYVTNAGTGANGSLTVWQVNTSSGALTNPLTTTGGFASPFGVVTDGNFVYMADNRGGTIRSFQITNTTTGAISQITSIPSLGTSNGNPVDLVIDPVNTNNLYVSDNVTGVIAAFSILNGALTFSTVVPSSATANAPFGIGVADLTSGEFILTANQGSNSIWASLLANPGIPGQPTAFTGSISQPKGLAIDPQNQNAYTADNGDGTVAQWALNASCGGTTNVVCFVGAAQTEAGSSTSGPFNVILTH